MHTYSKKESDNNTMVIWTIPHLVQQWMESIQVDFQHWSSAAQMIALVKPSSAAVERVFSILKASFGPQQDNALQDYIESSLMLQYNHS